MDKKILEVEHTIREYRYACDTYEALKSIRKVSMEFEVSDWRYSLPDKIVYKDKIKPNTDAYRILQERIREAWSEVVTTRAKLRELGVKI